MSQERRIISLDQFLSEAKEKFGEDPKNWLFICPVCKTIQGYYDFKKVGLEDDKILKYIAFSCIGRFTDDKGCDWTLGGFLQIHKLEVMDDEGEHHPRFEFAPVRNEN